MDFLVKRDDFHEVKFEQPEPIEVGAGEALLEVDRFGFTANNITYAVFGEAMNYWSFFPGPDGWGRIPVWGFAEVAVSEHPDLKQGAKVFGYLPMSRHLRVKPEAVDERGFIDITAQRLELPPAYNRYALEGDPAYDAEHEDELMILIPLFFTSFLIDDFLGESGVFGAESVILGSASSKTAIGLAHLLSKREGIDVIGLTSNGNVEFVEGTGVYDHVVDYESIEDLLDGKAVYVDMSGNREIRGEIHRRYGDDLVHSAMVGNSHWEQNEGVDGDLPGPQPIFFFAPDRIVKRGKDWGPETLLTNLREAWDPFVESTSDWLEVERGSGPAAVEKVYREVLEGESSPATGHVLSMEPD